MDYEAKKLDIDEYEITRVSCKLKRVLNGNTLIIGGIQKPQKNEGVIKLLKQAWSWSKDIENGISIIEISKRDKVSYAYINRIARYRFLSPKIQKMILRGECRDILTSHNLRVIKSSNFKEQEKQVGFKL